MTAAKRNYFETCMLLLENGADPDIKNDIGLTAFDYSVLYCNYKICLFFKEKYNAKLKEIDYYLEQGNKLNAPLFNIILFFECLNKNLPVDDIPTFNLSSQQKIGKIFIEKFFP